MGGKPVRAWWQVLVILVLASAPSSAQDAPATITIAMPGDADEGRYVVQREGTSSNATFAWSRERFADAWGRDVDGHRVSFDGLGGGASCSLDVNNDDESIASSTTRDLDLWLHYAPGDASPAAYGGELRNCVAGVLIDPANTMGPKTIISYDAWPGFACLFRAEAQGRALAPGTSVARVCGALDEGGAWEAAAHIEQRDGLRVLRLDRAAVEGTTRVDQRVWWADGLAYPLRLEWSRTEDGEVAYAVAYELVALRTGGDSFPAAPLELPPPRPELAPVEARLGPRDEGARLPLSLAASARAAEADPTLLGLQALLGAQDATLASATMRATSARGAPPTDATWDLLFAAPGRAPVLVTCAGASPAATAIVRCHEDDASTVDAPPEGFGASAVPATGVTFAEALARLEAHHPAASGRPVTHAAYRAWATESSSAFVSIGDATFAPVSAVSLDDEGGAIARLDLATGRSTQDLVPVRAPVVVQALPEGTSIGDVRGGSSEPARAEGALPPSAAPIAIGATAALALGVAAWFAKGALAAFFTRLVRPKVLEAELRASVHELVLARPGVHASEIIQHFDRGTGAIEYHLDVLVREGFLTSVKTSGFRHYFAAGRFSHAEMRALAALRAGQAEKLYRLIEANPGIHVQALAERAGLSVGYVSKEVKRLNEAGLVDQVKVGRAVTLHPLER